MTKTVDPFAGSYVVESMTDDVEDAAFALIQQVEDKGGAVEAIEQGFQKSEIERSAYAMALQIDSGERTVVGLNTFVSTTRSRTSRCASTPRSRPSSANGSRRCARTATTARSRGRSRPCVRRPRGTDNLLYPMKEALAARATGGEVSHALRDVWGLYVPRETF